MFDIFLKFVRRLKGDNSPYSATMTVAERTLNYATKAQHLRKSSLCLPGYYKLLGAIYKYYSV